MTLVFGIRLLVTLLVSLEVSPFSELCTSLENVPVVERSNDVTRFLKDYEYHVEERSEMILVLIVIYPNFFRIINVYDLHK